MATLRDIQRRIKAVKSTRQITKAMKMVAAAKLRRAQSRMLELRPYADKMNAVIKSLAAGSDQRTHPLLAARPRKTVEVLVMTGDRGLCGAFNANILKAAVKLVAEVEREDVDSVSGGPVEVRISSVGKKARDYYRRRNIELKKSWTGISDNITYVNAQEVTRHLVENFVEGTVDEVYLVYSEFINVVQQNPRAFRLLPLVEETGEAAGGERADFIYEPSEEELLERLLPKNVEIQVYRALLESQASEQAARMTSMENATKSANEMIDNLTLQYNKARQASITAELMDIVGGVEALKKAS